MDRLLVTGSTGQVGRATIALHGAHRCMAANRSVLPLEIPEALPHRLDYLNPRFIINCGAYTAVDAAEKPEERIFVDAVNAESPARLARWAASRGVPLVHFSTDYVFDGSGSHRRSETDATGPLNVYGETKLAGEKAILESGAKALIFRTSWVYDRTGRNFFNTMLRLGAERETLNVVFDQVGAPTYAPHLALAALEALERALAIESQSGVFPTGVYHLCGGGETSWHGFAERIFSEVRSSRALSGVAPLVVRKVEPISTARYPTPARRPLNSRLDCSKALETLGVSLPHWSLGLEECLNEYFSEKAL